MRVGIGYDIHALKKGRKLVLGGVHVPFPKGLSGHSDADVLFHAVLDAVLGAAGASDIGENFSDKDKRYKNVSGTSFAAEVMLILRKKKLRVSHIDSVIIAEAPKLGPFKENMKKNLAKAFSLNLDSVSVKAKTNEGLDSVGQGKAIACYAVASLKPLKA